MSNKVVISDSKGDPIRNFFQLLTDVALVSNRYN